MGPVVDGARSGWALTRAGTAAAANALVLVELRWAIEHARVRLELLDHLSGVGAHVQGEREGGLAGLLVRALQFRPELVDLGRGGLLALDLVDESKVGHKRLDLAKVPGWLVGAGGFFLGVHSSVTDAEGIPSLLGALDQPLEHVLDSLEAFFLRTFALGNLLLAAHLPLTGFLRFGWERGEVEGRAQAADDVVDASILPPALLSCCPRPTGRVGWRREDVGIIGRGCRHVAGIAQLMSVLLMG